MSSDGRRAGSAQHRVSPVAAGLAVFAGALMIVSGIGVVFEGIAAVFNDEVFASTPQYLFAFGLTAWGWIHLFPGCAGRTCGCRGHPRAGVGPIHRDRARGGEPHRQLHVPPALPLVGDCDHRSGHRGHLGTRGVPGGRRVSDAAVRGRRTGDRSVAVRSR
jgi:hypothetical protein